MPVDHRERAFEYHLIDRAGYILGAPKTFDSERAFFPNHFLDFVRTTQPDAYKAIEKIQGSNTDATIIDDLTKHEMMRENRDLLKSSFRNFNPRRTTQPLLFVMVSINRKRSLNSS
jgi:hypothetical protein